MQRTPRMSTSSYPDTTHSQRRPLAGRRRGGARRGPDRTWALGTTVALAVALAGLLPAAMAAVQITEVQVNDVDDTITITGMDFSGTGTLAVILGEINITAQCQILSNTVIICTLSGGLPPAGDYRLTVARGSGQGYNYDLTIGAVGPEGPEGPPGPTPHFIQRQCGQGTNPCPCRTDLGETIISGGAFCPTFTFLQTSARNGNAWEGTCNATNNIPVNASLITILCCTNCAVD